MDAFEVWLLFPESSDLSDPNLPSESWFEVRSRLPIFLEFSWTEFSPPPIFENTELISSYLLASLSIFSESDSSDGEIFTVGGLILICSLVEFLAYLRGWEDFLISNLGTLGLGWVTLITFLTFLGL